jgi:hypothetical protein
MKWRNSDNFARIGGFLMIIDCFWVNANSPCFWALSPYVHCGNVYAQTLQDRRHSVLGTLGMEFFNYSPPLFYTIFINHNIFF